ncbi:MAG: hypothetical protein N838_12120 [Thiohalocapsa sp. PB-PSB1]|jgi:hypothetical protein|nr:MAG: hypothetical protein N838_12120 [Thiohalocapsa sp. PB-PSB1]HCS91186.1 hypothetical protein [Chromatiaceae bacterium]
MEFLLGMIVAIVLAIILLATIKHKRRQQKRERIITHYEFPASLRTKLHRQYPHLTHAQLAQAEKGLRDYFLMCNTAGRKLLAMPSQAVDLLWHEFILFTRQYQEFCQMALGRFLHHTPAEAMSSPTQAQQGIKNAWRVACAREKISPRSPKRLPLLFAMDALLDIPDGFHYSLNCEQGGDYCAGHIGCGSGCAGDCGGDSGCGGGCGGD